MSLVSTISVWDNELFVYSDGRVEKVDKRTKRRRAIKQSTGRDGYCCFGLTNADGDTRMFRSHRVIYLAHNQQWDILDVSKINVIDHKDRNILNNNIDNLRLITQQQNMFNRNAKGYYYNKIISKWQSQIIINGKNTFLGTFIKEADASNAYQSAKLIHHII